MRIRKRDGAAFSFSNFTPKKIIFNAIKEKLDGTGISKITMIFVIETEKYNVMLSLPDGGSTQLSLEKAEVNTIKKILITKIVRKYREQSDKEIQSVIIEVNMDEEDFKIFIQDKKNEVEKFNY